MAHYERNGGVGRGDIGALLERALQQAGGHVGPAFGARGSVLVSIGGHSHRKGPGEGGGGERSGERAQVPRGSHSGRERGTWAAKVQSERKGNRPRGDVSFLEAGPTSSCCVFPQPNKVLHTAAKVIQNSEQLRERLNIRDS